MLLNASFIAACLLLVNFLTYNFNDDKPLPLHRRQTSSAGLPALSDEAKAALEKTKLDGKARLEAVTAAGGTVTDREILLVIKKAAEENPKKDHPKAITDGFIALTDQKLAEAKSGKSSSPQRRQTSSEGLPALSDEAKAALEKTKADGKARLAAVTAAGGTVTDREILLVIKKAAEENPKKDHPKAITDGFIALTDQKLAEAKSGKSSSPQRRQNSSEGLPPLSDEAKAALEKTKADGKARLAAVTAAGGTVTDREILLVIKKAAEENPKKDHPKAITDGFIALTDQKLAEAKSGKSSAPQRRQTSSDALPPLSDEAKAALEKTKADGKARLAAVTAAGGTVTDREILLVIKKAAEENPKKDHPKAITDGFIALTDQKLAEAKAKSSA
ncbi:uncharacterized protein MELLADRAFT_65530 [Melampsora larici-populina 98AG31]|uniref:Secreted protein n=1 Tax=Melampsora larici-populina (strain 98AG31 / pathotype 3-4-7) TaxID=747676 RepID=F4RVS0_MELLP|nr:uncharacterized protein MELLADRAFT_65530 [Melampsora larici-populina 98AG31]EGG03537.1 hypothetical protein MELLADRAFT_65530 [Melampsora larici-populina 98AG31]